MAWETHVGGGILGSGVMATAANLIFFGGDEGFVAVDATDGKRLWQFNTNQNWRAVTDQDGLIVPFNGV